MVTCEKTFSIETYCIVNSLRLYTTLCLVGKCLEWQTAHFQTGFTRPTTIHSSAELVQFHSTDRKTKHLASKKSLQEHLCDATVAMFQRLCNWYTLGILLESSFPLAPILHSQASVCKLTNFWWDSSTELDRKGQRSTCSQSNCCLGISEVLLSIVCF